MKRIIYYFCLSMFLLSSITFTGCVPQEPCDSTNAVPIHKYKITYITPDGYHCFFYTENYYTSNGFVKFQSKGKDVVLSGSISIEEQ